MNVSQENTSKVAAVVKVGIVKADYEEKVEKVTVNRWRKAVFFYAQKCVERKEI